MLSESNARVLWWACEQQLWALEDLFRLAHATDLISGSEHLVLHGLTSQLSRLVIDAKENSSAVPQK